MEQATQAAHASALANIVGAPYCHTDVAGNERYTRDYRGLFGAPCIAVVMPRSTAEVSAVVRYCAERGVAIIPQGGNTSLLGGAVPDRPADAVIVSLQRLNVVEDVDAVNNTMTVGSGVTLHQARHVALEHDRLFPLRIGSEGSCQIGGNISTNAGGTAVLRYGNMRELILGLEVVLPDGEVWDGLRGLRKDNTGYDLKHWFIGAEGTLGIVTRAVLKLFPHPKSSAVALVGLQGPEHALALLNLLKSAADTSLTAFELISRDAMALVLDHLADTVSPLPDPHAWFVLIELSSGQLQEANDALLLSALESAAEQDIIENAAVASSQRQAQEFWRIREEISDAQTRARGSIRCDVSVPLSSIPAFIAAATAAVLAIEPGIRMVVYGHMGDGNVHFNPLRPASEEPVAFMRRHEGPVSRLIDDHAARRRGSISAEHGVGVAKRDELLHYKSGTELRLGWALKRALDPQGIMNPRKVLPRMEDAQG